MKAQAPVARRSQRGAATLVVVLGLLAALLLAAVFAHRGLLLEARMSANQARSTVAFEAAEAGLDWAAAQLNTLDRIGADCRADASAATSLRERMLTPGPAFGPRVASDGAALRAACTRSGRAWQCSCPSDAPPAPPASADADPAAFNVGFLPGGQARIVRIASTGSASPTGATARVEAAFALLPALAAAPPAALTARGAIRAGATPIGVHNDDARSAGIAMHAGGPIDAAAARITTAAGGSLAGTLAGEDAGLAAMDDERLFAAHFGMARGAWSRLPVVRRIDCDGDCGSAVTAAVGADVVHPLVWITGDTTIEGPSTLGRVDRPVVIVVDGRLGLRGPVEIHGVVYANGVAWTGTSGGALHGALISAGDFTATSVVDIHRDAAVLSTLMQGTGSFVRVPGSWRDF